MHRTSPVVRRALAAIVLVFAVPAPAHAGTGPRPTQAPLLACEPGSCRFDPPHGVVHDGFRFWASSREGVPGSYGWWEHRTYQPTGTYVVAQLCNGTIPYSDAECGPPSPVGRVPAASVPHLIDRYFGAAAPKARQVAWCESRYDPEAVSPGGHVGVYQLDRVHERRANRLGFTWAQMYEAEPNIIVAYDLFREQSWRPWSCA